MTLRVVEPIVKLKTIILKSRKSPMKSLYKDPSLSRKSSLLNRRGFFSRVGDGLHGAALVYLLSNDLFSMDLVQSGGLGKIAELKSR